MTQQDDITQCVLTDEQIMRSAISACDSLNITRFHEIGAPSKTIMDDAGLLELGRAIESALLSKLRAPVADEHCSACNPQVFSVEQLEKDPLLVARLWRKPVDTDGSLVERILKHVSEYGESMASSSLLSVRTIARRNLEARIEAELADAMRSQDESPLREALSEIASAWSARTRLPEEDGIQALKDIARAALASAPVAGERLSDATLAALVNKHGLHALPIMQVFEFAKDVCAALESTPVAKPVAPDLQAQIVALRRPNWPSTGDRSSFHEGYETARVDILRLLRRSAPVAGEAVTWEAVRQELAIFLMGATGRSSKEWHRPLDNASEGGALARMRACLAAPQASAEPTHKPAMSVAEFCAEAGRLGLTADTLAAQLSQRPEVADCLPQTDKDGGQQRAGDGLPAAPLRVFAAGIWTYDGTGQALSHTELDEAAFVTYRAALSAPQAEQGERDA